MSSCMFFLHCSYITYLFNSQIIGETIIKSASLSLIPGHHVRNINRRDKSMTRNKNETETKNKTRKKGVVHIFHEVYFFNVD